MDFSFIGYILVGMFIGWIITEVYEGIRNNQRANLFCICEVKMSVVKETMAYMLDKDISPLLKSEIAQLEEALINLKREMD